MCVGIALCSPRSCTKNCFFFPWKFIKMKAKSCFSLNYTFGLCVYMGRLSPFCNTLFLTFSFCWLDFSHPPFGHPCWLQLQSLAAPSLGAQGDTIKGEMDELCASWTSSGLQDILTHLTLADPLSCHGTVFPYWQVKYIRDWEMLKEVSFWCLFQPCVWPDGQENTSKSRSYWNIAYRGQDTLKRTASFPNRMKQLGIWCHCSCSEGTGEEEDKLCRCQTERLDDKLPARSDFQRCTPSSWWKLSHFN